MIATTPIYAKQVRLAQHYLCRLRTASRAYQSGDENSTYALRLAAQDWPQIQQWQAWTVMHADQQHEAAVLCSAYPYEGGNLLDLMLTPQEHRAWRESALAAARDAGEERAELAHLQALSVICCDLDAYAQAEDYAERGLILAQRLNEQVVIVEILWILGQLAVIYRGGASESRHYTEESLLISREIHYQVGIGLNLLQLALLESDAQDNEQADRYAEQALSIFRQIGSLRGIAKALRTRGSFPILSHDVEEVNVGLAYLQESLRLYRTIGDRVGMADVYPSLVLGLFQSANMQEALAAAEEGLELCRQTNSNAGAAAILLNIGAYLFDRGEDLPAARNYCEQSLQIARQIENPSLIASNLWYLGFLAAFEGDFAMGLAYGEESVGIQRNMGAMFPVFLGLNLMAFAAIGLGQLERARTHLLEAFSLLPDVNDLSWIAAGAAWLCLRLNKREQALTLIRLIEAHYRENVLLNVHVLRCARQELEAALSPEALAAALEQGRMLDFDATVAEIIAELRDPA